MCLAPHRDELRTPWFEVTLPDLRSAEELLDCLERCGCDETELWVRGNARFAVRWRW
jgi:hypothetical protein